MGRLGYDGDQSIYFDRTKFCVDPDMVDDEGNRLHEECEPVEVCEELESEITNLRTRVVELEAALLVEIGHRDGWENRVSDIADALGVTEEWSNLNDRGLLAIIRAELLVRRGEKAEGDLVTAREAERVLGAMHQMAEDGGWVWAVGQAERAYIEDSCTGDFAEQTERGWNRAWLDSRAKHEGYKDDDERIAATNPEPRPPVPHSKDCGEGAE